MWQCWAATQTTLPRHDPRYGAKTLMNVYLDVFWFGYIFDSWFWGVCTKHTRRDRHTHTHIFTYIHAYTHTHLDWTCKHPWCHGTIIYSNSCFMSGSSSLRQQKRTRTKQQCSFQCIASLHWVCQQKPCAAPCPCRNKNKFYIFWGGPHTHTDDPHTHTLVFMHGCIHDKTNRQTNRQEDRQTRS